MDVRCGRCGTEYEFDDALISERGTTVKCTNCGYQFKVFPDAAAAAPERWVVRTVAGRELVYTTLKDLQRGIARGHVGADDMLSRGNRPARPLSAIPELEPFLRPNTATIQQQRAPRTLHGVAPAANASSGGEAPPSLAVPQSTPSVAPARARPQSFTPAWDHPREAPRSDAPTVAQAAPGVTSRPATIRSDAPTAPPPPGPESPTAALASPGTAPATSQGPRFPSSAPTATNPGGISLTAPTVKRTPPGGVGLPHDLPPPAARDSSQAAPAARFAAVEPPTIPRFFPSPEPDSPPTSARAPAPAPPVTQEPAVRTIPPREQPPRELLPREPTPPEPAAVEGNDASSRSEAREAPEADPVARGLAEARALLQHDDQTDPYYVTSATRRNARSRWLVLVVVLGAGVLLAGTVGKRYLGKYTKSRELAASQTDATVASLLTEGERLLARGELEGATEAFNKASARADKDPQVLTLVATLEVVRADVLWLKQRLLEGGSDTGGEQTRRELARQVVSVRGAVERTRLIVPEAASTARLLVHAKRLGGEVGEARRHVTRLTEDASLPENAYALAMLDMADPAPVWSSVVHRLRIAAAAEGPLGQARAALVYALVRSGSAEAAKAELERLAKSRPSHPLISDLRAFLEREAPATAAGDPDAGARGESEAPAPSSRESAPGVGGDFRALLKQAYAATERGQLATAERLYNAVLAKQPGNTEALSGLADIAQRRNDTSKASQLYAEVLRKNPSYLPALMASADQKWASGDHAGAVGMYRRILQQAGADSSYGRRAAQRIAQAEQEASSAPSAAEPEAPEDAAPDTAAPAEPAPDSPPPADEPAPAEPKGESAPHIDTTDLPELNQ